MARVRSVQLFPSEKYGSSSVVTRDGVGNYYLIMTTAHIQDIALGNTHAPSASYHDLAVGVQEWRRTSIDSILGGYKCESRPLRGSKGGIWRESRLRQHSYYYGFRKMLVLTINKHHST